MNDYLILIGAMMLAAPMLLIALLAFLDQHDKDSDVKKKDNKFPVHA
jgi:hypothetical protein